MCSKPSLPTPISTNAPNNSMRLILPCTSIPTCQLVEVFGAAVERLQVLWRFSRCGASAARRSLSGCFVRPAQPPARLAGFGSRGRFSSRRGPQRALLRPAQPPARLAFRQPPRHRPSPGLRQRAAPSLALRRGRRRLRRLSRLASQFLDRRGHFFSCRRVHFFTHVGYPFSVLGRVLGVPTAVQLASVSA